ncbi:response regulator [Halpernia frigidisoli]|uniref:Two-component system, cell cycle response regulator DivK n=1 Tax=Halpernia frigidisoli TaxID=1125876 RepID=A0A1I3CYS9_9FLAO|nr:response regulator [Halpernia frigidisoli]SFH79526.1 two-component system, cell cycle response regulator DivK [Halpernia frigidisoli]
MIEEDKKVLIFDDNVQILELCTEILEDLGCEIKTSPTTMDVVEQVLDFMPDLILMDNWLPDVSGIEATQMIKAHEDLKDIPVVYFSANTNISSLAEEAGADGYFPKPFDIYKFEEMVKLYLKVK